SAVGSWADNAAAERFFGLLKRERVNRRVYRSCAQARSDIFDYNNERIKLNLNGLSPGQYRTQAISITAGNVQY
ncbi:MAG: IS3 family transposase, partial [Oxalobacter sp.]|nr:IS3 family transposase [Oxalobacter sp.]